MKLLKVKYTKPIEREFEAWIISSIEKYFDSVNTRVAIFAVSPVDEPYFPADEFLGFDCKVIGLQLKKASLGPRRVSQSQHDFSNLYWDLHSPPAQFPLIQRMDEIYYCLPTFVNRDYKNVALDHCIFWRPEMAMKAANFYYDNDNAGNEFSKKIESFAYRWGQFVERIISCKIGIILQQKELVDSISDVSQAQTLNLLLRHPLYK